MALISNRGFPCLDPYQHDVHDAAFTAQLRGGRSEDDSGGGILGATRRRRFRAAVDRGEGGRLAVLPSATIGCELAVLSSGWRFLNLTTPHAIGRPIGRTVGKDDMRRPNDQVVDEHSLTATAEVRVEQGCDR
jgi:hypothetical protein